MLISFVIPSFNHANYISHTLTSIVKDAKGINFEIILIDDGSTDESKAEIRRWLSENSNINIKVIFRENKGVSATLNELINLASGEIIRCCASDDLIYAGSSSVIISKFKNTDALVLVGDALVIDEFGHVTGSSAIELAGGSPLRLTSRSKLRSEIIGNWSIPGPCFAIKREVYSMVGKYSEDLLVEDWDFFLRVAALCKIEFIKIYFSYYRVHSGNASRTAHIRRRIRNLESQYKASRRRAHLFNGSLRILLELQSLKLGLKILVLRIKSLATLFFA